MTMSDHETAICKSVNFHLWNLSRIRKYITQEACLNEMRALLLSKLDYANALLSYLSNKDIIRLQRLQNRAARIIFQVLRRHSSSPPLKSLHWLPVDSRIKFKIMLYINKILNNMTSVYLRDCVKVYVPAREGLRSAMDTTRLKTPLTHKTVGDRSFSCFGSELWNNLPPSIRSSPAVDAFKRALKTYLS